MLVVLKGVWFIAVTISIGIHLALGNLRLLFVFVSRCCCYGFYASITTLSIRLPQPVLSIINARDIVLRESN